MLKRFVRVIIGIVLIITSPITLVPSLLLWVITKELYLYDLFEWCVFGDND